MSDAKQVEVVVRHRVAIAGRVVDAATDKPLGGADVKIVGMPDAFARRLEIAGMPYGRPPGVQKVAGSRPTKWDMMRERPDRTQSRLDGLFYFLDLPDGDYSLQAALPSLGRRFGKVEVPARVSRDADGNVKWVFARCALPPTLVKGRVVAQVSGQKAGVALARVRVKGSGELGFTDAQGHYMLTRIEPAKKERELLVTAQGYPMGSRKFLLPEPGAAQTVKDIELVRENG